MLFGCYSAGGTGDHQKNRHHEEKTTHGNIEQTLENFIQEVKVQIGFKTNSDCKPTTDLAKKKPSLLS